MTDDSQHLQAPIAGHVRKDFPKLQQDLTVQEALDYIRQQQGLDEQIVYFYVVDERERLVGVLPTRRLLTAPLEKHLSEIMDSKSFPSPAAPPCWMRAKCL
jgi:magnesium transporter